MRNFRFIALLICLSLLLGCSTIQTDIESSAQPESAAASPPTSSVSEQELVPEEETLSSVADLSEESELPTDKTLAQHIVKLDDIEKNKWINAIELIPGYPYDDPEQEPYELVIDVGEYQIGWPLTSLPDITIYSKNDKISLNFEDIREPCYDPIYPAEDIKLMSIYGMMKSVIYTGSKLYFAYMAEMSCVQQTYQIYQWDLDTKELKFVSQYPGCGILEILEIQNGRMVLYLGHSWGTNRLISIIDLDTGKEIEQLDKGQTMEFLETYDAQSIGN